MFTVGGNSLSGKFHPGPQSDETIFTSQLCGILTALFSQLTLKHVTGACDVTIQIFSLQTTLKTVTIVSPVNMRGSMHSISTLLWGDH